MKLKRVVPDEVLQCRDWLKANGRVDDYNFMLLIIGIAENEDKLAPNQSRRLASILIEYTMFGTINIFHF